MTNLLFLSTFIDVLTRSATDN